MNHGWNRCPIFSDPGDRFLLLKTLAESGSPLENHPPCLFPDAQPLPFVDRNPLGQYQSGDATYRWRVYPLFRGRFKSILVQKEKESKTELFIKAKDQLEKLIKYQL